MRECEVIFSRALNVIQIAYGATGTISDNTVEGHTRSSPWPAVGILIYESNGVIVGDDNTVENGHYGILLDQSIGNEVAQNEISRVKYGIVLNGADENNVIKNKISDSLTGILFHDSHDNKVMHNEIADLTYEGIFRVAGSSGNKVAKNEISQIGWEIVLNGVNDNDVLKNDVADSSAAGISAWWSSGNLVKKNVVSDSDWFDLFDSSVPLPLDTTWENNTYQTSNF